MSETPNKTDSRVAALAEVKSGQVEYDPSIGEYLVTEGDEVKQIVRGARRRTFSELRTAGVIEPSSISASGLIRLTGEGVKLAKDWRVGLPGDPEVD